MSDTEAREEVFGWSPDGKRLLFASDRTGHRELWAVQISDGKPQGPPQLLRRDLGRAAPLGLTRDGSLFLATKMGTSEVYLASVDWESGRSLATPRAVGRRLRGVNRHPAWSPDGGKLAYISGFGGPSPAAITIMSTADEAERPLAPKLSSIFSGLSWAPDGRSVLVHGFDEKHRRGVYSIDVDRGDVTPLVADPSARTLFGAEWISGSEIFYYRRIDDEGVPGELVILDTRTGAERPVPHGLNRPHYLHTAVSPDRRAVAVLANATDHTALRVAPLDDGTPREILRRDTGTRMRLLGWTHDAVHVIVATFRPAGPRDADYDVWRIPALGGAPEKLPALDSSARRWSVHPDGHRVAFDAGGTAVEIAVLENVVAAADR